MELSISESKRAYSWFHSSFDDYKNNEWCTKEDIVLRNKIEGWLIENGQ